MNRTKTICLSAFVVGGLLAPPAAQAITTVTNTATANYKNEAAVAQAAQVGSTVFSAKSDPVLSVVKTRNVGSGPAGTVVIWTIKVTYPRIADIPLVCGDDSNATNVVVTDPIPAAFTYNAGTLEYSTDNGTTFNPNTDVADGDALSIAAGVVTANIGTMTEGQGDAACTAGTAILFRFATTKN